MAISTGGFGVNVMPTYTPVDPSLAAFNPAEITKGMLNHFQMQGTVAQLQAFKQHAQEVADTEAQRTQILKQQAEQDRLKLESAAALHKYDIDRRIAEAKAAKIEAEGRETVAPSATEDTLAKYRQMATLRPGTTELGLLGQTRDIGMAKADVELLPFAIAAKKSQAETQARQAAGELGRVETTEGVKDINASMALDTAKFAEGLLPAQQQLVAFKLADDLKNAQTDRDKQRAHLDAQNTLLLMQAKKFEAEAAGTGRFEKDPFTKYSKVQAAISNLGMQESRLWNQKVPIPGTKTEGDMAQYLQATRKGGIYGGADKSTWLGLGAPVPKDPAVEQTLEMVQRIRKERARLEGIAQGIDIMGEPKAGDESLAAPAAPAPVAQPSVPKVSNQAEYDALTSGQSYLDPNGVLRIKK